MTQSHEEAYTPAMDARIPPDPNWIELLEEPLLPAATCRRLLDFFLAFHERNIEYFLHLRNRWLAQHPDVPFPGLCANVNPLTGEFRPEVEQLLWGWGDGRALATWSGFLAADRVPAPLRTPLRDYVDAIYSGLRARCRNGIIPFSTHYREPGGSGEGSIGYSTSFASAGFCRYGLLAGDSEALDLGLELFRSCEAAIAGGRFDAPPTHHGPWMILLGTVVDVIDTANQPGCDLPSDVKEDLLEKAHVAAWWVLDHHFREDPPGFWEHSDRQGHPVANADGHVVTDPGHATEFAGFLAELVRICGEGRELLDAALAIHLFSDSIGFTPAGVMTKYADLNTREVLGDTQAAKAADRPTAPWWNVREHAAAAIRLYTLTGDRRLLSTYQKAQNASYLHYPNERIGGQMIQSVDPWTCEPLDIAPATGNLDPMHDARARMREIECLELLIRQPQPWKQG